MIFSHLNRRLHLYLGMFLLPWFFIYGVSSIPFAHNSWFQKIYGPPQWTVRFDRPYSIEVPAEGDLRPVGARILADAGIDGAFGASRNPKGHLNIYRFNFRQATRITYFPDEKRLLAEDRRFRWDHFLTGMHARGGFQQPSILNKAWGVVVDIVCIGILLWIASGVYMWWHIPGHRRWGWAALAGGVFSFALFLLAL
jgi:hypothetical protein